MRNCRLELSPSVLVITAIGAICALFSASVVIAERAEGQIGVTARAVAQQDAAEIRRLAAARTEVRVFEGTVREQVARAAAGRTPDLGALRGRRAEVAAGVRTIVWEAPADRCRSCAAIGARLGDFEADADGVLGALERADVGAASATAESGLRASATSLARVLMDGIDEDARRAQSRAVEIAAAHHHAGRLIRGFSILGLALAGMTAAATVAVIRRHERQIRAAADREVERSTELEEFASRVAHDIASPLSAVSMAVQLALRHSVEGSPARGHLELAGRSLARVHGMVGALLQFARAGGMAGESEVADVEIVVRAAVEDARMMPDAAGIEFVTSGVEGGARVRCSAGLVASMVSNFLTNAVRYMGERAVRRVEVRVLGDETVVRVSVCDTGPGVPPRVRSRVFDPYVRADAGRAGGIGLGLATVRRIAIAHGGAVGVESRSGGGSEFWFELPRA